MPNFYHTSQDIHCHPPWLTAHPDMAFPVPTRSFFPEDSDASDCDSDSESYSAPAPRTFAAEDIGTVNPEDIADALIGLLRTGQSSDLARILSDRRWFQLIVTLKGSRAQIAIDRLQHVRSPRNRFDV